MSDRSLGLFRGGDGERVGKSGMVVEGRPKKAAKPKQGLMFGTTDRFESKLGWSNQKARDEARFALSTFAIGDEPYVDLRPSARWRR